MRCVAWTPIWDPDRVGWGTELLRLTGRRQAVSTAIQFDERGDPYRLAYRIAWDRRWRVRRARIGVTQRGERRSLSLRSDGRGGWSARDASVGPDWSACVDIDLWPTPFTNTFPIRRLGDRLASRTEISVLYIRAPALEVSVARQAYTRLAGDRFLFESLDSEFQAELEVDGNGIVLDYPGLFLRLV